MDDQSRLNLSESLRSTATGLTEAAQAVAGLGDDQDAVKAQAKILDRIGDDAREAASILRYSLGRQRAELPALPPRRIPPDSATGIRATGIRRVPPDGRAS